ncbi:MAG: hypothetical protein ACK4NH_00495 [Gemmobacter sp.]|nr:hypothetical protein [Gemmobacter sp.]
MAFEPITIGSAALAVVTLVLLMVWRRSVRHRGQTHAETLAVLQRISEQIDAIHSTGMRGQAERAGANLRLEQQLAATCNDLEWLLGDRMIEMASQYVRAGASPEQMARELDMPLDMAQTVTLFRKH